MAELKVYKFKDVKKKINVRPGETKIGEKINFISGIEDLKNSEAKFVIFGIPEDIGVRANLGKAGTSSAWEAFLNSFLNIQENKFLSAEKLILLGEIDCTPEMTNAANLEPSDPNYFVKLGELVENIDAAVSGIIQKIVSAGKIPIVIGGGHNNAYGNIKGASEALKNKINVLNIDAHTDLRKTDYRHSGNGFSFSRKNNFLDKYLVFGLHENYTPQYIFDAENEDQETKFIFFEELLDDQKERKFEEILPFISEENFGMEMDCDAIANFPSSAISPTGFTINEIRNFIKIAAGSKNCLYLHLCEAISKEDFPTGKALSGFVSDFIKENGRSLNHYF